MGTPSNSRTADTRLNGASEQGMMEAEHVPPRLQKLMLRIASLQPGQAYAITLYVPECQGAEPVWAIAEQGKLENDRGQRT